MAVSYFWPLVSNYASLCLLHGNYGVCFIPEGTQSNIFLFTGLELMYSGYRKQYPVFSLARKTTNSGTEVLDLTSVFSKSVYFNGWRAEMSSPCTWNTAMVLNYRGSHPHNNDRLLLRTLHWVWPEENHHLVQFSPPKLGRVLIPMVIVSSLKRESKCNNEMDKFHSH